MAMASKSGRIVSLFLAASLSLSGCSSSQQTFSDDCDDDNNDGYCDDDGSRAGHSYINANGKKKYKRTSGTVSSGAKGGIGSSGYSSSG